MKKQTNRSMRTKLFLTALAPVLLAGCATLGGSKKSTQPKADGDAIVHQSGAESPAISRLNRDQWVSIRDSAKDPYMRLYSALGAGEWETAAMEARAHLAKNPKDYVGLSVLSTALAMQKNYSLAAFYGNLLDKYHPGNSESDNLRGLATLYRTGARMEDFRKAEAFFIKSFSADSRQVAAGLNLGRLYLDLGRAGAAREIFAQVRTRCNDCVESLIGFGIAQSRIRDFDGAKQSFLAVIAKDSKNAKALYRLALIEQNGYNNNKGAVQYLEKVLALNSNQDQDVKRRANFMLRKIQASEYGGPVEAVVHSRSREQSDKVNPEELLNASDIEE